MALATLCSALLHDKSSPSIKFQAFIVDHRVRDGSSTEAAAVSKELETRGKQFTNLVIYD